MLFESGSKSTNVENVPNRFHPLRWADSLLLLLASSPSAALCSRMPPPCLLRALPSAPPSPTLPIPTYERHIRSVHGFAVVPYRPPQLSKRVSKPHRAGRGKNIACSNLCLLRLWSDPAPPDRTIISRTRLSIVITIQIFVQMM
ncbi:hypothetical protein EVAR_57547_1 [Eumeta japonica]|uniref:Uncharacterized protein n=1 Tax=Eumeta variegata TaxID=151549 RepID=A0A4C1Y1N8_EUMVA|nr:hypothetical protein EVAR_57547_1 [Eumeta japonica]